MLEQPLLAFFNAFSPMHLLLILVVALLLFGNRLPEVARSLGRSLNEFKKGLKEVQDGIEKAGDDPPPNRLDPPNEKEQGNEPHDRDSAVTGNETRERETVQSKPSSSDGE